MKTAIGLSWHNSWVVKDYLILFDELNISSLNYQAFIPTGIWVHIVQFELFLQQCILKIRYRHWDGERAHKEIDTRPLASLASPNQHLIKYRYNFYRKFLNEMALQAKLRMKLMYYGRIPSFFKS